MLNKTNINQGVIIIISAPSGCGKSTIIKELLKQDTKLKLSVSATSRTPRFNEINGIDYWFIGSEKFMTMIDNNEFLEYTKIYENYYGTVKNDIIELINNGYNVILDIDYDGLKNVKNIIHCKIISIFITPPNMEILRNRLIKRNTDSQDSIKIRSDLAENIMSYSKYYNHVVINDKVEHAVKEIQNIINMSVK